MRIRRNAQLKPTTMHLVLFKSTMAGCYSACLQLYCRAQRASVPNLFIQGSQVLHQPTCIPHLQNVSSVLSPKNAPPLHFIIYSNTCQQRESADFHPTTSDFCGKTALFCGKSTNKEVTGSSQADPSGSRIIQAVSRRIFLMLRGLLICSVAASLLFNRDFSDGSHDW